MPTQSSSTGIQPDHARPSSAIMYVARPTTPLPPISPSNAGGLHDASKPKLKRNRLVLSCQPCHTRKQQCDRGHPCSRCIKRGSTDRCAYSSPVESEIKRPPQYDTSLVDGLPARVAQLESLVQATLGSLEPHALSGIDALLQLVHATNVITTATTSPRLHASTTLEHDQPLPDNPVHVAAVALGQLSRQNTSIGSLDHPLVNDETDPWLLLPEPEMMNSLVAHFFNNSSIPWLYFIMHRPTFDNCYMAFVSAAHSPTPDFPALLAVVCLSALQFLPEDALQTLSASGRQELKRRLHNYLNSALFDPDKDRPPTVEKIQGLLLMSIYYQNEGNISRHFETIAIAIGNAQSLGLHRDGVRVWNLGALDAEIRRRLWWSLYVLDRMQCFLLRRPYNIQDNHCDVDVPLNTDQLDLVDSHELTGKHPDHVTDQSFHLIQINWSRTLGRIWEHCFSVQVPTYNTIVMLEEEIREFEMSLPAAYRTHNITSVVAISFKTQIQFLALQIYHARVILLRPFLLVRSQSQDIGPQAMSDKADKLSTFHSHAQDVCRTFCKRLLAMQYLLQNDLRRHHQEQLRWSFLVWQTFDAALALSVAIMVDSRHPDNDELFSWIALAVDLLLELGAYNVMAPNAIRTMQSIQRLLRGVPHQLGLQYKADIPPQRSLDRSMNQLMEPQKSLCASLAGLDHASDEVWMSTEASVFHGTFPGPEAICGNANPESLQHFLNNCAAE